ncbi:MAG: hypothetical protein AAF628_08260 [Planctomycetota bacterium]
MNPTSYTVKVRLAHAPVDTDNSITLEGVFDHHTLAHGAALAYSNSPLHAAAIFDADGELVEDYQ